MQLLPWCAFFNFLNSLKSRCTLPLPWVKQTFLMLSWRWGSWFPITLSPNSTPLQLPTYWPAPQLGEQMSPFACVIIIIFLISQFPGEAYGYCPLTLVKAESHGVSLRTWLQLPVISNSQWAPITSLGHECRRAVQFFCVVCWTFSSSSALCLIHLNLMSVRAPPGNAHLGLWPLSRERSQVNTRRKSEQKKIMFILLGVTTMEFFISSDCSWLCCVIEINVCFY